MVLNVKKCVILSRVTVLYFGKIPHNANTMNGEQCKNVMFSRFWEHAGLHVLSSHEALDQSWYTVGETSATLANSETVLTKKARWFDAGPTLRLHWFKVLRFLGSCPSKYAVSITGSTLIQLWDNVSRFQDHCYKIQVRWTFPFNQPDWIIQTPSHKITLHCEVRLDMCFKPLTGPGISEDGEMKQMTVQRTEKNQDNFHLW